MSIGDPCAVQNTLTLATKAFSNGKRGYGQIPAKPFNVLLYSFSPLSAHLSKNNVVGYAFEFLERILTVNALEPLPL